MADVIEIVSFWWISRHFIEWHHWDCLLFSSLDLFNKQKKVFGLKISPNRQFKKKKRSVLGEWEVKVFTRSEEEKRYYLWSCFITFRLRGRPQLAEVSLVAGGGHAQGTLRSGVQIQLLFDHRFYRSSNHVVDHLRFCRIKDNAWYGIYKPAFLLYTWTM